MKKKEHKIPPKPQQTAQSVQQQLRIQEILARKQKIKQELAAKMMSETLFPSQCFSWALRHAIARAMKMVSPLSFQARIVDFANALKVAVVIDSEGWDGKVTLDQAQVLFNSIEAISFNDHGRPIDEYLELVEECISHSKAWGELVQEIPSKIDIDVEAEYKRRFPDNSAIPMSTVKGEA